MDTQNLWIIDAKSTNNLFDNLCQIYARTIDLAQEEQVDVETQVSKAKPRCTAHKVCGSF